MTPEVLLTTTAWATASSYACALVYCHGATFTRRVSRRMSEHVRLRKVGGIWFLSAWRLRFSFCIARRRPNER